MTSELVPSSELISVCICTFRRQDGLNAALERVAAQILPPSIELEVIVVDNDLLASARAVYAAFQTNHPSLRLFYAHEVTPGVSFARNRCLREASGKWVAFLDDDEVAPASWLATLWHAAQAHDADAVFGPVQPIYEGEVPEWLLSGRAHERPRFSTGMMIGWGDTRSGYVLMHRRVAEVAGGFDSRFASTGGEDSFFFACALRSGLRMVWCDEAVISETVPLQRMTRKWVIQRAFYGGRTYARLHAALYGRRAYVKWFIHGLG